MRRSKLNHVPIHNRRDEVRIIQHEINDSTHIRRLWQLKIKEDQAALCMLDYSSILEETKVGFLSISQIGLLVDERVSAKIE